MTPKRRSKQTIEKWVSFAILIGISVEKWISISNLNALSSLVSLTQTWRMLIVVNLVEAVVVGLYDVKKRLRLKLKQREKFCLRCLGSSVNYVWSLGQKMGSEAGWFCILILFWVSNLWRGVRSIARVLVPMSKVSVALPLAKPWTSFKNDPSLK